MVNMDPPPRPSTSLFDVYLRLRPSFAPNAERFLDVEKSTSTAPTHITIRPPANDHRKRAIERFAFTQVFEEDAAQLELFKSTGLPSVIEGVIGTQDVEGRDGLLATLGVTGSGKSHTILGSKAQRGLTQMSLDVLFQAIGSQMVNLAASERNVNSIQQADVSEAQILSADAFLDILYGDSLSADRYSRGPSRATTPMMVSAYPEHVRLAMSAARKDPAAGLYPALSHYKSIPAQSPAALTPQPCASSNHALPFPHSTDTSAKTSVPSKDASFMSLPSNSRRHIPRLSTLPRYPCVDDVALQIDQRAEYAVVVSMYEVYNDRIFDLLAGSTSKNNLQKRRGLLFKSTEHSTDKKVVAGLRKVVCCNLDEALLVLETGLAERRVAGTGSNASSSRSHGFFCLEVKKRHRSSVLGLWSSSSLTIVDLAGSERARTAKTAGATLAEAGKINESLMYLGQCMQMQSDNAEMSKPQSVVPFRQCKLTELLFSNSFVQHAHRRSPQKAIMIVTADPLGDFNATSQILRYSALAREVTVPRIPSVTSTILSGPSAPKIGHANSGRTTPTAMSEDLEHALTELAALRQQVELAQFELDEERRRRVDAELSWKAAEDRIDQIEQDVREEVWVEMEAQLHEEQRRWRAARDEELDRNDEHIDKKLEILSRGISVHEDPEPSVDDRVLDLEDENARLKARIENMERERGLRSPSKKMKVLKTRKWEGSGVGLDCSP